MNCTVCKLTHEEIAELDPGIRDTVVLLRDQGFETTDSGDGVSKQGMGCALDFPHVFAVLEDKSRITEETDRMQALLGDNWICEATYSAKDRKVFLMARPPFQEETTTQYSKR